MKRFLSTCKLIMKYNDPLDNAAAFSVLFLMIMSGAALLSVFAFLIYVFPFASIVPFLVAILLAIRTINRETPLT